MLTVVRADAVLLRQNAADTSTAALHVSHATTAAQRGSSVPLLAVLVRAAQPDVQGAAVVGVRLLAARSLVLSWTLP